MWRGYWGGWWRGCRIVMGDHEKRALGVVDGEGVRL